jgi:N-acyl-phosphatidylethanolamine-hydrolysing phospholipase D
MKILNWLAIAAGIMPAFTAQAQSTKTFQWIGGPTYILQLGSFRILADPMLAPAGDSAFILKKDPMTGRLNAPVKRLVSPAPFDTAGIDLLMISHLHADHMDQQARDLLQKSLPVILPPSNVEMIKSWGFMHATGLEWNSDLQFQKGEEVLHIIAVRAMHAAEPLNTELGKVNGYIIEYKNGDEVYRIYWTGDTIWFDDIKQFKQYGSISLLLPHLGAVGAGSSLGRRGLNAAETIRMINALHPALTIPVHHTTFSHYREPISVLQQQAARLPRGAQLLIPEEGKITKL